MKGTAAVTLSNENGPSRSRPSLESWPPVSGAQRPLMRRDGPDHASPGSNGVAGHATTPHRRAGAAVGTQRRPNLAPDRFTRRHNDRSPEREE